jgi:uncharacterized protein (TIGR02996 family)
MEGHALASQLVEAPDDVGTHLVYADWLQACGDPRGVLIVLQQAGQTDAANALLQSHAEHFYGSLAARPRVLTHVEWRLGFIRSCRFALERRLDSNLPPDYRDGRDLVGLLDEFLGHASARLIHALSLGPMKTPYNAYGEALDVLARHTMPTLRTLTLGDDDGRLLIETTLGDPAPLATIGASLHQLVIRTGDERDATLDARWFPQLRELHLAVASMTADGVATLLSTPWRGLEALRLEIRDLEPSWAPLFAGHGFPAVRHLGLHAHHGRHGFLERIATSDLLARLETLELTSFGFIESAEPASVLLTHRERFAHLKRLTLRLVLDEAMREALRGLCPDVRFAF